MPHTTANKTERFENNIGRNRYKRCQAQLRALNLANNVFSNTVHPITRSTIDSDDPLAIAIEKAYQASKDFVTGNIPEKGTKEAKSLTAKEDWALRKEVKQHLRNLDELLTQLMAKANPEFAKKTKNYRSPKNLSWRFEGIAQTKHQNKYRTENTGTNPYLDFEHGYETKVTQDTKKKPSTTIHLSSQAITHVNDEQRQMFKEAYRGLRAQLKGSSKDQSETDDKKMPSWIENLSTLERAYFFQTMAQIETLEKDGKTVESNVLFEQHFGHRPVCARFGALSNGYVRELTVTLPKSTASTTEAQPDTQLHFKQLSYAMPVSFKDLKYSGTAEEKLNEQLSMYQHQLHAAVESYSSTLPKDQTASQEPLNVFVYSLVSNAPLNAAEYQEARLTELAVAGMDDYSINGRSVNFVHLNRAVHPTQIYCPPPSKEQVEAFYQLCDTSMAAREASANSESVTDGPESNIEHYKALYDAAKAQHQLLAKTTDFLCKSLLAPAPLNNALYLNALERTMALSAGMLVMGGCHSAKDRDPIVYMMQVALAEYFAVNNRLPDTKNAADIAELNERFAYQVLIEYHQQTAEANHKGCYGVKHLGATLSDAQMDLVKNPSKALIERLKADGETEEQTRARLKENLAAIEISSGIDKAKSPSFLNNLLKDIAGFKQRTHSRLISIAIACVAILLSPLLIPLLLIATSVKMMTLNSFERNCTKEIGVHGSDLSEKEQKTDSNFSKKNHAKIIKVTANSNNKEIEKEKSQEQSRASPHL
ncbi:MAG: hypothetical protein V4490_03030 [Pseudomonadota bacterium]